MSDALKATSIFNPVLGDWVVTVELPADHYEPNGSEGRVFFEEVGDGKMVAWFRVSPKDVD